MFGSCGCEIDVRAGNLKLKEEIESGTDMEGIILGGKGCAKPQRNF